MATPQDTVIDTNIAYEAIQENFSDLTTASIEPIWLAHHLFSSKVITLQQMKETTDGCLPNTVKLSKLLTLVLEGVQRNGHVYTSLLNILSKEGDVYRWLIEGIKNSYERILKQPTIEHTGTHQHIEYTVPEPVEYNMASSLSTSSSIFNQKSTSFQNTGIHVHVHIHDVL